MERICLISGSHVASNPRLVKEADTLHAGGHPILVLGSQTLPAISRMDTEIQSSRPWKIFNVKWGYSRRLKTRLRRARARAAVLRGDDSIENLS